ncbi:MAG: hypothetical protein ACETVZ_03595, partial [Phycisphaerae bacterium]
MCKKLIPFYVTCPRNIHDDGLMKFLGENKMFHQSSKQILLGIFVALLLITMPVYAVKNVKISNYGGGHQIWFEAEDYDERIPDEDRFYAVVDAAGAFGQAITRDASGGRISWTFDISKADG